MLQEVTVVLFGLLHKKFLKLKHHQKNDYLKALHIREQKVHLELHIDQ